MSRVSIVLLVGLLLGAPAPALAQVLDARGMSMGGLALDGPEAARTNPALLGVPPADGDRIARRVTLPLGLLQWAIDGEELDGRDADFDAIRALDAALDPPWSISSRSASAFDVDARSGTLRIVRDLDRGRFEDGRMSVSGRRTLFEWGSTYRLGPRRGTFRLGWCEVSESRWLRLELGDGLEEVLFGGAPPAAGESSLRVRGESMLAASTSIAYVREWTLPAPGARRSGDWLDRHWDRELARPRLWTGLRVRRVFGLARGGLDAPAVLRAGSVSGDHLVYDYAPDATWSTSRPRGLSGLGSAAAVDVGAVLRWRGLELDAGVSDLFADPEWSRTRVDRFTRAADGSIVRATVERDSRSRSDFDPVWRARSLLRLGGQLLLGLEAEGGAGGVHWRGGAERSLRPDLWWRGGLERDDRGVWHPGAGIGLHRGAIGFDLGARTHARQLSGRREIEFALTLVLR